jgi:hypothetical protein
LRTEENNDKEFSVRIIHIPATMWIRWIPYISLTL